MPHRPIDEIFAKTHPYDALPEEARVGLAQAVRTESFEPGDVIYELGKPVSDLCLITSGTVHILDTEGAVISILEPGNSFGERGLMRDGVAPVTARADGAVEVIAIPGDVFKALVAAHPSVRRFFDRTRADFARRRDVTTMAVGDLMTPEPLTCTPDTPLIEAAAKMRGLHVSCIIVVDAKGGVRGILTTGDITARAVAEGLDLSTPVEEIMTPAPIALPPSALVADVLHAMVERGISHLPVVAAGALVGILTQTDLTRFQATSSASLIRDIRGAPDAAAIGKVTGRIPDLLVQLVGAQNPHQTVTRLITDIGDAATRRLLKLAEAELGPPPVPYLWLACGSQGRQEQTGVSDQDNCLILHDDATEADDAYFAALAKIVCDGLDRAGYFYCPGDMMASNPKWRQPLRVWQRYFAGWIDRPDPQAQMLASVMFDLRGIGGDATLFEGLQERVLAAAAANSIFVAHLIGNSLKHTVPLGLFRGFATVRSGEHKNTIDLKMNGVVPVVDLGRIYALKGKLPEANTRARIAGGMVAGALSQTGGRDLMDAYDLIAEMRLEHQAAQIRRGEKPDNFMSPGTLSDFERAHLRDAFVVVKTMQSAAGSGRGYLT